MSIVYEYVFSDLHFAKQLSWIHNEGLFSHTPNTELIRQVNQSITFSTVYWWLVQRFSPAATKLTLMSQHCLEPGSKFIICLIAGQLEAGSCTGGFWYLLSLSAGIGYELWRILYINSLASYVWGILQLIISAVLLWDLAFICFVICTVDVLTSSSRYY